MKQVAFILFACLTASSMYGKPKNAPAKHKKYIITERPLYDPLAYITTGTGFNHNTGILGFSIDVPVSEQWSVEAGPGIGTWGAKFYAGAKYYLQPYHRGFAFGGGLAYCTGTRNNSDELKTVKGNTETIVYDQNPRVAVQLMAYKYWNIGKKYNRFYVESGLTVVAGNGPKITQVSGTPMDEEVKHNLGNTLSTAPILAVGISFAVNRKQPGEEKKDTKDEEIPVQRHHLFADVPVPFLGGFSVTYNYGFARHWAAGLGIQGYKFFLPTINGQKFVPAMYGELRLNIRPEKKNQFFSFLNLGIDFYKQDNKYFRNTTAVLSTSHNNGLYTGLAGGYQRRMTKRGGGPYVSLKMVLNWHGVYKYSLVSESEDRSEAVVNGFGDFCLGFKF